MTALVLAMAAGSSASAQACFIDKTVESDGVLDLFIRDIAEATFISGPPGFRQFSFRAQGGVISITAGLEAGKVMDRLSLGVDDTVALQRDAQRSCALTVSRGPAGLGFDWSATTLAQGAAPAITTGHVDAARP